LTSGPLQSRQEEWQSGGRAIKEYGDFFVCIARTALVQKTLDGPLQRNRLEDLVGH
jgi:hypothetical protein